MAIDSTYVVGPKAMLEGLLNNPGFNNRGAVRYSLDQTQILLEEDGSKFDSVLEHQPQITLMTESEAVQFIEDNRADWEEEIDV